MWTNENSYTNATRSFRPEVTKTTPNLNSNSQTFHLQLFTNLTTQPQTSPAVLITALTRNLNKRQMQKLTTTLAAAQVTLSRWQSQESWPNFPSVNSHAQTVRSAPVQRLAANQAVFCSTLTTLSRIPDLYETHWPAQTRDQKTKPASKAARRPWTNSRRI